MTFKDKPKRAGGKTFDRDRKPKSSAKPSSDASAGRDKKTFKEKPEAAAVVETVASKPERISKIMARAGVPRAAMSSA